MSNPMTTDAGVNKDLVERVAKAIYDLFPYDGLETKPAWVRGGNSLKQDEARRYARVGLSALPLVRVPEGQQTPLDRLLALTDSSNWPEMKGDLFRGYNHAMQEVHELVMECWDQLAAAPPPPGSTPPREPDDLVEVLEGLVSIIDAAGLHNLCDGVQLGASSWYVKAVERLTAARAALTKAKATGGEGMSERLIFWKCRHCYGTGEIIVGSRAPAVHRCPHCSGTGNALVDGHAEAHRRRLRQIKDAARRGAPQ